jgi:hypothetical protein
VSATPRLRAPRQDGAVLAEPPLEQAGRLLDENRRLLAVPLSILGRPLVELRQQARQQAVAAAAAYLRQAGEPVPTAESASLILAGHQPELFHPGVWVKNFALNALARRHGATPLNLIVDNDTAKSASLRLPTRDAAAGVHLTSIAFDRWTSEIPYEELPVHDEELFASFAERAMQPLRVWPMEPLLPEFWTEVRRQAERTPLLGERFAAARRTYERRWGCHNLEVPLSALCRSEAFAWFACHILTDLPRFHAVYNAGVQEHRRQHGIRSRNHPVPDLARDGDWYETPFWAWRAGQTRRGRLFVQVAGDQRTLRSGDDVWMTLPAGPAGVAAWLDLERQGCKVRTRALTTTLFSRLLLADLFIHGIGGGKYDELTDELMRRFFGCAAPAFLVLSATLLLPVPVHDVQSEQRRGLAHQLRDLAYNPQRHLGDGEGAVASVRELVARKQALIEQHPESRKDRRQRFSDIRAVNGALQDGMREQTLDVQRRLNSVDDELRENAVLQRRDFAFCLFPEAKLRPFCEGFLQSRTIS